MIRIGIFASGSGTNAENFCRHFVNHGDIRVAKIYTNNPHAGVIQRSSKCDTPVHVFTPRQLNDGRLLDQLKADRIDAIVLAGFMQLIPIELTKAFPDRILNIHPALLPNYGGKGMYGSNVHRAVIENGDSKSGITIHLVNEKYDEGRILFQAECVVTAEDDAESLAQKVHELEYMHYPEETANYLLSDK